MSCNKSIADLPGFERRVTSARQVILERPIYNPENKTWDIKIRKNVWLDDMDFTGIQKGSVISLEESSIRWLITFIGRAHLMVSTEDEEES